MEWSEFLESFYQRHPECRGQGPDSVHLVAKKAIPGVPRPIGEQMHKERVEFDRKQATADHDDGEVVDDGLDSIEPEEETK